LPAGNECLRLRRVAEVPLRDDRQAAMHSLAALAPWPGGKSRSMSERVLPAPKPTGVFIVCSMRVGSKVWSALPIAGEPPAGAARAASVRKSGVA